MPEAVEPTTAQWLTASLNTAVSNHLKHLLSACCNLHHTTRVSSIWFDSPGSFVVQISPRSLNYAHQITHTKLWRSLGSPQDKRCVRRWKLKYTAAWQFVPIWVARDTRIRDFWPAIFPTNSAKPFSFQEILRPVMEIHYGHWLISSVALFLISNPHLKRRMLYWKKKI